MTEEHTKEHTHKHEGSSHKHEGEGHKHEVKTNDEPRKEHGAHKCCGTSKSNIWMAASIILGLLLIVSVGFNISGDNKSPGTDIEKLSSDDAKAKTIKYINENLLSSGQTATANSITEENGMYKIELEISGRTFDSYVSYDGKMLFPQAIDLEVIPETPEDETPTTPETPETTKTDKPVANGFVMSYCPYGLQFMKAYVPVMELLGSKADIQLNFVNYAMHGEKEIIENNRMYCIQKEQKALLTKYLRCFIASDDSEKCQTEVGIDKNKLESCIDATDKEFKITELYNDKSTWSGGRYPVYPVDQVLATKYAVRGSPSFVVNGKTVSVNRSPEAVKQAICAAFTTPPAECDTALSSQAEGPGIGPLGQASASGSTASCG